MLPVSIINIQLMYYMLEQLIALMIYTVERLMKETLEQNNLYLDTCTSNISYFKLKII
mgnify:CR=1 FL=1